MRKGEVEGGWEAHDCDGAAFGFAGSALWFGSLLLRGLATEVRDDGSSV